jgi:hypothetical protein
MKLHLLILASLFHLSSAGFMAELRGQITEEVCSGEEYADFKRCVEKGLAQGGENLTEIEEEAFVNRGNEDNRHLEGGVNYCSGCTGGAGVGTFCYTVCGGRRRLEQGTDKTGLRRLPQAEKTATIVNGVESGNGKAKKIARSILDCLATDESDLHPCLGSTNEMALTVVV